MHIIGQSKRRLSDTQLLLLLALGRLLLNIVTNGRYGFHQDALAFLENGRHLDWGYVAYPPLTPFIGRIGLTLFGTSLIGIKSISALAQAVAMFVTGLMARELGGGRRAQVMASLAAGIGLMSLLMGTLFQYISFDYLWWILIAYCLIRLLKSDNPRWWLAIGALIGLGMMTKYTMAFFAIAIALTAIVTHLRAHLRSGWLWGGVTLSLLIFAPNFYWQVSHDFVSLEFLNSISTRDREMGRSDGFFSQQLYVNLNPLMLPLFLAGVSFYVSQMGKRFRPILVLYIITILLFAVARGRFYYTAPAYPMILAGGAVSAENWLRTHAQQQQTRLLRLAIAIWLLGASIASTIMLPVAPVNSTLWNVVADIHDNFYDQIGWQELAEQVAQAVDDHDTSDLRVIASHYGIVSAINLHANIDPPALGVVNTFWERGRAIDSPNAILAVGFTLETLDNHFTSCTRLDTITNQYHIEKSFYSLIYCESPTATWSEIWNALRGFS